jgi:hypothetical protein
MIDDYSCRQLRHQFRANESRCRRASDNGVIEWRPNCGQHDRELNRIVMGALNIIDRLRRMV